VVTTLGPTRDLVAGFALKAGRDVKIVTQLAEGAFQTMMDGDPEMHDQMVFEAAQKLKAEGVEIILLAQASMTRLAEGLAKRLAIPVLSSPALGIAHLAEVLSSR